MKPRKQNKKELEFETVMKWLQIEFKRLTDLELKLKRWYWLPGRKSKLKKMDSRISIIAYLHETCKSSKRIITKR